MSKDHPKFFFSVLNVGQGSLQLIEEGDSINIVIDCNLQGAPEFVKRYFHRRKVGQIDLLILSGKDDDHADADGLEFLKNNWEINRLWYSDFEKDSENWNRVAKIIAELEKSGTVIETPKAGDDFDLGSFKLKVLSPHDDDSMSCNNASIVVRIQAGDVSGIFPGDCELSRWENVRKYFSKYLPANLLLVPHHGSDNGCDEDLLRAVKPEYSIISAGEDNQYGHPDKKILKLVTKYTEKEVFITYKDGSVLFESDGKTITNVLKDAGQDEDGKKVEKVASVAGALAKRAPVFVSRGGLLSTSAGLGTTPVRPTVSHGGEESVADDQEAD